MLAVSQLLAATFVLTTVAAAAAASDSAQPGSRPAGASAGVTRSSASFHAFARQPTVGLGDAVTVEIDGSAFVPTANGTVIWPFVNGSQFGAFVTCAVLRSRHSAAGSGNCSLILPLPYAGDATIELAVFREGRDWGGKEGAWAAGEQGPCDQTAGCVYPVGQAGPPATATARSARLLVHVPHRRVALPQDVDAERDQVCINYEPWFTKLNIARWEGRSGASGVPLVGFYSSSHPGVIRQHAMWLTEAGVTCINLDFTNMLWNKIQWPARGPNVDELLNSTAAVLREYATLRDEGHDAPRVMISLGLTNMLPSALHDLASWVREHFHRRFGLQNFVQLAGVPVLPVLYLGDIKPFSVPFPTPEVTRLISVNGSFAVRYMGVSLERNASLGLHFGFWSWMDSSDAPVPAMRNGAVEALTVTNAYFKSGQQGGWLGAGATPQRRGETLVSEMQHARQLQPKILLVTQWNEWAGAPDGNKNAYSDDYNLTLSNEIEPVSLTECGGYIHHDDEGQLPVCNTGYGFRNLNVLAATLQAYRDATQPTSGPSYHATTVVRLAPVVYGASGDASVSWSTVGPCATVKLTVDGVPVVAATNSSNATLDTRLLRLKHGSHQVCAEAVGGWSRFKLAKEELDEKASQQPSMDCVSFDV
jgi:hypothetical protein